MGRRGLHLDRRRRQTHRWDHGLVKVLREEGCEVLDKIDDSACGKFAWVIDPEGNKVELWQPLAGESSP